MTTANVDTYDDTGLETSTTYWYRVRAYNSAGNSGYSNVASGTTSNGGAAQTAPIPEISVSDSETTFMEGGNVVITTSLNGDASNLARVEFFSDGMKIGEVTGPPYSFIWSDAPAGNHSIIAVSVNRDGSTMVSAPFTLTIVASSRMISLSTRGSVDNANPMIAGFVISGDGPQRVLLRAVGKGIENFGVTGVVDDPAISISKFGSAGVLVETTDGWDNDGDPDALLEAMTATGAFPLQRGSRDAAVLVDLDPGLYTAVVSDTSGKGGVCLVEAYLIAGAGGASSYGKLTSLSTRGYAGSGNTAMIAGLVVEGSESKRFIIRGIGPGLSQFGVNDVIQDPQISVIPFGEETPVAQNLDWSTDAATTNGIAVESAGVGAFALPQGSRDAVVLVELDSGIYTIVLSPERGQGGAGLIEVYELNE